MDSPDFKKPKGTVLSIEAKKIDGQCYIIFYKVFEDGIEEVKYPISNKFLESWS